MGEKLNEHKEYIEDGNLVSEISGTWEAVTKDANGEAHIHTLHKHSKKLRPLPEEPNLDELLVRKAIPTIIRPTRRATPKHTEQEALIFGDAQVPFQDERAMNLALTAIRELMPNQVVFVGDMLDLPGLSRFQQRNEWQSATQGAIDYYHQFLAQVRANAPNADITVIAGNHEERMTNYVQRNAAEVLRLRRAGEHLSVLSIRNLVRFDDLDIRYVDGYPNGTYYLEPNLQLMHGTNVAKGGSNAAKYLEQERASTIYGHTHRLELAQRTYPTENGRYTVTAASPGALAKVDGSVPGFRYSVSEQGEVVKRAENWQQGLLQIHHEGLHHDITPIQFTERGMVLNGKRFDLPEAA